MEVNCSPVMSDCIERNKWQPEGEISGGGAELPSQQFPSNIRPILQCVAYHFCAAESVQYY